MSKNFKAKIRDRYKGRGNCWVKVLKDNEVYNRVISVIKDLDANSYISHIEREGFAWIRFSKPSGDESNKRCLFEVRYKGSKLDHPDVILDIEDSLAERLPLLGNTPVKLQLETEPAKRKAKKENTPKPKKRKNARTLNSANNVLDNKEIENKLESIKEAKLTKATEAELREWELFLKAEGLLDFAI